MVTGAHTNRMDYVRQAGDEVLPLLAEHPGEWAIRATQEIQYYRQELDAGRLKLPIEPGYRLTIDWAEMEGGFPPEIEERLEDLQLLLQSPFWPLPWYLVPSRPFGPADKEELTRQAVALYDALVARDVDRAVALCAEGNGSLDITLGMADGHSAEIFQSSLQDVLDTGNYTIAPWVVDDLVIIPEFDNRRVKLRHRSKRWTFDVGPHPVARRPIAMDVEAFLLPGGWKLAN